MTDQPYAVCTRCPETFADKAAAQAHGQATLEPTGEAGITHRGHGYRVVNPSPEEIALRAARNSVSNAVREATDSACEEIQRDIDHGLITPEAAREALADYPDFRDAWDDWCHQD